MSRRFPAAVCGVLLTILVSACAGAAEPAAACRIGFDIGSSGIRVGATHDHRDGRVAIDYLGDVWADGIIDATDDATVAALTGLGGGGCTQVAGAYSAWRLAVERAGAPRVADTLAALHRRSGVAIFVIPQAVEGSYGYVGARRLLGERLTTPFILDIGGGSMQIASAQGGWGTALGQKAWRKLFCTQVKGNLDATCAPNPVGPDAIARARQVLAPQVEEARASLGIGLRVTAVSAPVVRGIHPLLATLSARHVIAGNVDAQGFDRTALDSAVALLAEHDDGGILRVLECGTHGATPLCSGRFAAIMVTDMLLVRTFMEGLAIDRLEVAEADLTNVPGLLADPRAADWAAHYGCYLEALRSRGVDAFTASPQGCR